MSKKQLRTLISMILVLFILVFAAGCGQKDTENSGSKDTSTTSEITFEPGTYSSTQKGNFGDVPVTVTFSEKEITKIEIGDNQETPDISGPAFDKIMDEIMNGQTLKVDTVSGATNSSNALLTAVEDCVKQAGGDVTALKEKSSEKKAGEPIEKTADIVVIGGGGAGLAAATSAAEDGASVILIEKGVALGGNTIRAGGAFNSYDPDRQKSVEMNDALLNELKGYLDDEPSEYGDFAPTFEVLKTQIKEYLESGNTTVLFDSPELHAIHTYIGGKRTDLNGNEITSDYDLATTLTNNTLATIKWSEEVGVKYSPNINTVLGALWPRTHNVPTGVAYIQPFEAKAVELGTEIMLETKAEELIMKDGKVVGVKGSKTDGTPVTLMANKGVVVATGGFGANPEMRQEYNTYWPEMPLTMKTTNTPDATGDGIVMGEKVGAQLVGMGFIQLMPSSHPESGALSGGVWGSAETQVFVNSDGKRFVNEYAERDVLASAALEQEDQLFYIICDANTAGISPEGKNGWGDDIETLIKNKSIYKADTLEDLALQLGMEKDALVNEIAKYNGYIENKNDPDFGKANFGPKLETGPFYATPRSPSVHHTMGGLAIDTSARVLNAENQPIPGLYAAGEVTGGIHAGNRLGGNAIADILTYGKIAGQSAAAEK
ncbi:flavocytochrome c [Bacillus tuaregi]|uniref:flavocytochrome c n=1 Tax=Bacillus tuaregi TaxID=1816695 RepID=UPI0008F906CB|nr:flavocytochrome c [Bacillus tuaregi]